MAQHQPNRLSAFRREAHLTRKQVSSATGIDPRALAAYERGDQEIPAVDRLMLASYFEVSTEYLMRLDFPPLEGAIADLDRAFYAPDAEGVK